MGDTVFHRKNSDEGDNLMEQLPVILSPYFVITNQKE